MAKKRSTHIERQNAFPTKTRSVVLILDRIDLGQIIESLVIQQERWQYTANWHLGEQSDSIQLIEDSSNAEEAQWIADNYFRIVKILESQM